MLKLSKHTTPVLRLVCSTADICSTVRQCPVSHEASVSVLLSSGSVQCPVSHVSGSWSPPSLPPPLFSLHLMSSTAVSEEGEECTFLTNDKYCVCVDLTFMKFLNIFSSPSCLTHLFYIFRT